MQAGSFILQPITLSATVHSVTPTFEVLIKYIRHCLRLIFLRTTSSEDNKRHRRTHYSTTAMHDEVQCNAICKPNMSMRCPEKKKRMLETAKTEDVCSDATPSLHTEA